MSFPGSIPLCTRMGHEIPNVQLPDALPHKVEQTNAVLHRRFPLVDLRRPPTGLYNCHGLTFATRRTGIPDAKTVQAILDDDGYRRVPLSDVRPGDIVIYWDGQEISHTGLVLKIVEGYPEGTTLRRTEVLSKWGHAGEYYHGAAEGPYAEHRVEYWTDRP